MKLFEITRKRQLNENMVWISIYAPLVAKHARPGQFVILRTDEYGERVPLTMAGHDEEAGTIDIIFAAVGRSSDMMFHMEEGDCFADVVGPLGKPTHMEGLKRVCVVGGGTGNALAYPLATGMKKAGIETMPDLDKMQKLNEEALFSSHPLPEDCVSTAEAFSSSVIEECRKKWFRAEAFRNHFIRWIV